MPDVVDDRGSPEVTEPAGPVLIGNRWIRPVIVVLLCASCLFSSVTVNRARLSTARDNMFFPVMTFWLEHGFFQSYGLWMEPASAERYQRSGGDGQVRLHLYGHSAAGFLIPIYVLERVAVVPFIGRLSGRLLQAYGPLVVLIGSILLAFLALNVARRRGAGGLLAPTVALCAGLFYLNFLPNLDRAFHIYPSSVSSVLIIAMLHLQEREFQAASPIWWMGYAVSAVMFWMAYSDLVTIAGFFAVAVGLLSLYGVGPRIGRRQWVLWYVVPILAAFTLYQIQLWLGARSLGMPSIGTPILVRMGLDAPDRFGLGGHRLILLNRRTTGAWTFLAKMALVSIPIMLWACRDLGRRENLRDLAHVLYPGLTYLLMAAMFSEAVFIHPFIYDLFLSIPCILLVTVYLPLIAHRFYRGSGGIALALLIFTICWVWVSLVDYAMLTKVGVGRG